MSHVTENIEQIHGIDLKNADLLTISSSAGDGISVCLVPKAET